MRIGLDYLPAVTHPPGIGRYLRELVRALVRLEQRPELALLELGRARACFETHELGIDFGDPRTRRVQLRWPRRLLTLSALVGRAADGWLGGVDVFHQARLPALPLGSARLSLALSELPAPGTPPERSLARALRGGATLIVFSSERRERLLQRYLLPPERVQHVPVGCEHWRRVLSDLPAADRPARILVLGRLTSERAPLALLAACEQLHAGGLELELCFASPRPTPAEARAPQMAEFLRRCQTSPLAAGLVWQPQPTEADPLRLERALPRLVAGASVVVHLVPDAGSPVTPLEAFALGVPVLCPRLPAFVEALADEAQWVELAECVREPRVLAQALESALRSRADGAACDRRVVHARAYTWERHARATLESWRALAGAGPPQSLRAVQ